MRRIGIAAAVAVVVSLGVASGAAAAPLKGFDRSSEAVQTDGSRYATWLRADGASSVWDTATGRRFVLPPLAGCAAQPLLGGGNLVWDCVKQDTGGDVWVFNLARRRYARIPNAGDIRGDDGAPARFTQAGRNWLTGWVRDFDGRVVRALFVRLRDGVVTGVDGPGAAEVLDLDRANDPVSRLCRRIRRPRNPNFDNYSDESELFAPTRYERPYAITEEGVPPGSLMLRNCLGGRPRLLVEGTPIDAAHLGAGFVTWPILPRAGRAAKAVAHVPRSRRRFTWAVSGSQSQLDVRHTSSRVFVSQRYGERWLLRSAPFNPR